jgi:hypothetical protein
LLILRYKFKGDTFHFHVKQSTFYNDFFPICLFLQNLCSYLRFIKQNMKKYYILTSIAFASVAVVLMSSSSGRPDDRTGAPGSVGNCGSCHSGGLQVTTVTIGATEKGQTTPVTKYQPGKTYSIGLVIGGLSTTKGFQATVLDASNNKTGTTANASAGAKIITTNNRDIASHSAPSSTGLWAFDWTAPANPTGNVTIYAAGMAANGNGGDNGDKAATGSITLALDNSSGVSAVSSNLEVYPNPCSNEIFLPANTQSATVFSASGQKIEISIIENKINASSLSPGFYFVKGQTKEGQTFTSKIQKI